MSETEPRTPDEALCIALDWLIRKPDDDEEHDTSINIGD